MLKHNYSLNTSSNSQYIVLDDLYVSPDLSFVSGTTENIRICSTGDNLWIRSPYFPSDLPQKVTYNELVKRNGYIFAPKTLQIHKAKTYISNSGYVEVNYVEYNGNTYFSDLNTGNFMVDGFGYSPSSSFLTINEKIYIENDKVVVDGITYNALINNENELFLTDSTGIPYIFPQTWNVDNVTCQSKFVSKVSIGENVNKTIDCRGISYYGHRSYIIYDGEKKYLEYFYDENNQITGAGVKIDNTEYECDALYIIHDYDWDEGFNLYNINDYYRNENNNAVMSINGSSYIIHFEPCDIEDSGIIGVETVTEHLPILLGDRITIHNVDNSSEVIVRYDENGDGFICLNGRKYNVVKNLCDTITLGETEYELTYDGDCENPYVNMIVSCIVSDGSLMHFKVTNINNGKASKLKKVEYVNGEWRDLYSMVQSGSGVAYELKEDYEINHYNGIRIGDYNARVCHYSNISHENEEGETLQEYDYIILGSMLQYRLKVISTVGSNRLLCVPDVDITTYDTVSKEELVAEILYAIQGNNFVIEKRSNSFGNTDLYYDTWMSEAAQNIESISVYELADVQNNIRIIRKSSYFTVPIGLYKNISQKLEYEDLITSQYYDEEAEKAINKLVDMEKDMYSPVIKTGDDSFVSLDSMVFNLHFRTRDMETWKIIEDEGTYLSGSTEQQLSANYQYCNWFVTDYYPFYQYTRWNDNGDSYGNFNGNRFAKAITRSDLLGFLYFTTDDVKTKREKLSRSFLRLTFFDSKNPEKQNMLGTSTLYFDCNRYLNLLNSYEEDYHYEECAASRDANRTKIYICDTQENYQDKDIGVVESIYMDKMRVKFKYETTVNAYLKFTLGNTTFRWPIYRNGVQVGAGNSWNDGEILTLYWPGSPNHWQIIDDTRKDFLYFTFNRPTVLTQAIGGRSKNGFLNDATKHLYIGDDNVTLDSRITVTDRYNGDNSSEGFDTYILKAFANKKKPQTIYMKAEFFHAGIGIKIPMVLATDSENKAITSGSEAEGGWGEKKYKEFLKGYDLDTVFDRLYIPITIEYSKSLKKFVYHIQSEDNYLNAVLDNKKWVFNLFELKIKS